MMPPLQRLLPPGALLVLCSLLVWQHYAAILAPGVPPDAQHTYLPLASSLLQDGLAVFDSEVSTSVGPGSFVYMALAGASATGVKLLNLLLACLSVLLLYSVGRRLGSEAGGLAAASLYVADPLMQSVLIAPLSEPPFLFFTLLWLWATTRACQASRGSGWILLAALALAASVLTRGILFYWIFAAVVICVGIFWRARQATLRAQAVRILVIHLCALLPVAGYVAHNHQTHQVSMIATGSGTALYLGNNPATHGYEPPYFGLMHDVWMLNDGASHLTPANEKRLAYGARQLIKDQGLASFAGLTLNKFAANLFFSPAGLSDSTLVAYRSLRIILLVLALYGLWHYRSRLLVIMLGGVLLYQATILAPVMYNARYSMGTLELPLIVLAGLGAGVLLMHWRSRQTKVAAALTVLALAAGVAHKVVHPAPTLHLEHPSLELDVFSRAFPDALSYEGFDGSPLAGSARTLQRKPVIHWDIPPFIPTGGTPIVVVELARASPGCKRVTLEHKGHRLDIKNLRLRDNSQFAYGTAALDLDHPGGRLSITLQCKPGTELHIEDISIQAVQTGLRYREQILQQCAEQPGQLLCKL